MRKIDLRWPAAILLLAAALVVAYIVNNEHNINDSSKIRSLIEIDNDDADINWDRYQTIDVPLSKTYDISESGTYHLTNELKNGQINIDAGVGKVRLILDNISINNLNGPAIYCSSADDLVIELVGDNNISDGTVYKSNYDEDVTGTIYSKTDLTFQGDGTLHIKSNHQDAIVGKDDVKFNSGFYDINAVDDGIRGMDSVYIVNGDFNIKSTADAIKTTNEIKKGKGFVLIENGNLNIETSAKGINATNAIIINGGWLALNTYDDAIHSNNITSITGGRIDINSGDDAIHADQELIIEGGEISTTRAYEGFEAKIVTINDGMIQLNTVDDGINAGGGDEECIITINGGDIYINATGDGVDSNGAIYINDGSLIIDGPVDDDNGALDATTGIIMNGGEVIAIGSSAMAGDLGQNSSINNISIFFDKTLPMQTIIEIKDEDNNTILRHTAAKTFDHLAAGTAKFEFGKRYSIYLDGEKFQDFTINDITTTLNKKP